MAITDRSKDMAFRTHRVKPKALEDIEGQELLREDKELQNIQARLHYENAYHALSKAIIQGSKEYDKHLDAFKLASDAYYKLKCPHANRERTPSNVINVDDAAKYVQTC
jgi:hypothetical protein